MRKKAPALSCARRSRLYYVAQVGAGRSDAHAARTVKQAKELAMADAGDMVSLFKICAKDAGEARTLHLAGKSVFVRRNKSL